jgi:multidrug efflux pump subunit AcrA (membrane-fusion protein)
MSDINSSRYFYTFLRRVLVPEKRFYVAVFAYSVVIGLLSLAVPTAVQTLINTVATTGIPQSLMLLTSLVLVLLSCAAAMNAMQLYVMELFKRRFFVRISASITETLLHAVPEEANQSERIDRFFEIMHVQKSLPSLCVGGFTLLLQMSVGLVLVSFYHPLFLAFNVILLAGCWFVWRFWHLKAHQRAVDASTAYYSMANWLEQLARSRADFRAQNRQAVIEQSLAFSNDYVDRRERFFVSNFRQTIGFLVIYVLANVVLLALGGWLIFESQLTIGQLVAAELVLSAIFYGISRLGYYLGLYYELCAGALKLDELLSVPQLPHTPTLTAENTLITRTLLPRTARIMARLAILGVVLLVVALTCLPWVQTAPGSGTIVSLNPEGQAQSVQAPVPGRIAKWYVRDGSVVKAGDLIVQIEDNDPQFIERLQAELTAAETALNAAQLATKTASLDVHRKEDLFRHGLVSRRDMEQARIEYASWLAKEAEAASKLATAQTKFQRQQTQTVRAPRDGRILRTLAGDTATLVNAGDLLVTFAPESNTPAVELYVDGLNAPLIMPGRDVRLQFEGWPVVQFSGWPSLSVGTFDGTVSTVDPAVSANGLYRVLVVPKSADAWPDARYLRLGARAKGWVLLNEVKLGYEFWRQLNGFPPEPVITAQEGKK